MDRRLLAAVREDRIDEAPINANPAGDAWTAAFGASAPAPPVDSDSDGMPDDWEAARGLNPQAADHNGAGLSSEGYTNLEVYLHERAAAIVASANRAPRIAAAGFTGGRFGFSWSDEAAVPVSVERRGSLGSGNWTTVSERNMDGEFVDEAPPAGTGFYRVVVP